LLLNVLIALYVQVLLGRMRGESRINRHIYGSSDSSVGWLLM
jgi:hypothetical protein